VTANSIGEEEIENIRVDSFQWELSSTDRKVTSVGEWGLPSESRSPKSTFVEQKDLPDHQFWVASKACSRRRHYLCSTTSRDSN